MSSRGPARSPTAPKKDSRSGAAATGPSAFYGEAQTSRRRDFSLRMAAARLGDKRGRHGTHEQTIGQRRPEDPIPEEDTETGNDENINGHAGRRAGVFTDDGLFPRHGAKGRRNTGQAIYPTRWGGARNSIMAATSSQIAGLLSLRDEGRVCAFGALPLAYLLPAFLHPELPSAGILSGNRHVEVTEVGGGNQVGDRRTLSSAPRKPINRLSLHAPVGLEALHRHRATAK